MEAMVADLQSVTGHIGAVNSLREESQIDLKVGTHISYSTFTYLHSAKIKQHAFNMLLKSYTTSHQKKKRKRKSYTTKIACLTHMVYSYVWQGHCLCCVIRQGELFRPQLQIILVVRQTPELLTRVNDSRAFCGLCRQSGQQTSYLLFYTHYLPTLWCAQFKSLL